METMSDNTIGDSVIGDATAVLLIIKYWELRWGDDVCTMCLWENVEVKPFRDDS